MPFLAILLLMWSAIFLFGLIGMSFWYGGQSRERRQTIKSGVERTHRAAEARYHELAHKGCASAYRAEQCPHCGAAVETSGLPATAQIYCPHCQALATRPGGAVKGPKDEAHFRICPVCKLYAAPKNFRVGYVAFFVIAFVRSFGTVECCHACVRPHARGYFFKNLLTLVPMPLGLLQIMWAYLGGSRFSPAFKGLDEANGLSQQKQFDTALALYQAILQRVPVSAGIKYNCALTCLRRGDLARAEQFFLAALADCSNFIPAVHGLEAVRSTRDR